MGEFKGLCMNCGGQHHPKDCTTKGIKDCVVRCTKVPSKVTNFFGKPLPDYILQRLVDAQKKWLTSGRKVNTADAEEFEVEAVEAVEADAYISFGGGLDEYMDDLDASAEV